MIWEMLCHSVPLSTTSAKCYLLLSCLCPKRCVIASNRSSLHHKTLEPFSPLIAHPVAFSLVSRCLVCSTHHQTGQGHRESLQPHPILPRKPNINLFKNAWCPPNQPSNGWNDPSCWHLGCHVMWRSGTLHDLLFDSSLLGPVRHGLATAQHEQCANLEAQNMMSKIFSRDSVHHE